MEDGVRKLRISRPASAKRGVQEHVVLYKQHPVSKKKKLKPKPNQKKTQSIWEKEAQSVDLYDQGGLHVESQASQDYTVRSFLKEPTSKQMRTSSERLRYNLPAVNAVFGSLVLEVHRWFHALGLNSLMLPPGWECPIQCLTGKSKSQTFSI